MGKNRNAYSSITSGIILFAMLFASSMAFAVSSYRITVVGIIPGTYESRARGINNLGHVIGIGQMYAWTHAFVWKDGVMTDLGILPDGQEDSVANDINDSGRVVGYAWKNGIEHACYWDDGAIFDLGVFSVHYSEACAVSNSGNIAGWAFPFDGSRQHAVLWYDGGMQILTDALSMELSFKGLASDINNSDQCVGWSNTQAHCSRATVWSGDEPYDIGTLGGVWAEAYAINNSGKIVGRSATIDGSTKGFIWDGVIHNIAQIPGTFLPLDINDFDQVIGSGDYPFLWENGEIFKIQDILEQSNPYGYWYIDSVSGINNIGQIAATGIWITQPYNPQQVALLLTPIIELRIEQQSPNIFKLTWSQVGNYYLQYDDSPEFDSPLDSIEVDGNTTEYLYDIGTASQAFFRLKSR